VENEKPKEKHENPRNPKELRNPIKNKIVCEIIIYQ